MRGLSPVSRSTCSTGGSLRILLRGGTGKAVSGGYARRGVVTLGKLGVASIGREKDKIGWRL
ncbi:hypothetical protein [Herbidospora cretacea]|uniref:hypothetical protein n=1 Tax=Herbidospora cretacea TaxID=28444 RepID=UPI000AF951E4|nr:hypothetical protein [Herbidospora cretacea]